LMKSHPKPIHANILLGHTHWDHIQQRSAYGQRRFRGRGYRLPHETFFGSATESPRPRLPRAGPKTPRTLSRLRPAAALCLRAVMLW
jgi:hypothetical protein